MTRGSEAIEAILIRARELAIEHMQPGLVVERAIINGAYDKGTLITKWLAEAEKQLRDAER